MSGDEFVILCEDLDDPARADGIAVRVDASLTPPFMLSGIEVHMTASIGIAFPGRDSNSAVDLIRDADLAMYQIKRKNPGQRQVFDLRELHLAEDQAGLEQFLPGAAQRGELHLVYQPIVKVADGRPIGVEALLRWRHPGRGDIPPTVVIPLADHSGESNEMTYPVDVVKVDQTLIARLAEHPASRTIVTTVIQLAHGLGMTVVSEDVETLEQYAELARLECDACQGFYFARPMPGANLDPLIERPIDEATLVPRAGATQAENPDEPPGPEIA